MPELVCRRCGRRGAGSVCGTCGSALQDALGEETTLPRSALENLGQPGSDGSRHDGSAVWGPPSGAGATSPGAPHGYPGPRSGAPDSPPPGQGSAQSWSAAYPPGDPSGYRPGSSSAPYPPARSSSDYSSVPYSSAPYPPGSHAPAGQPPPRSSAGPVILAAVVAAMVAIGAIGAFVYVSRGGTESAAAPPPVVIDGPAAAADSQDPSPGPDSSAAEPGTDTSTDAPTSAPTTTTPAPTTPAPSAPTPSASTRTGDLGANPPPSTDFGGEAAVIAGGPGSACRDRVATSAYGGYPAAECKFWKAAKGLEKRGPMPTGQRLVTCQENLGIENPVYTAKQRNTWWVWAQGSDGVWDWFPETAISQGESGNPINGIALCE